MKLIIDIDEELYKNVVEHTKDGYIGSDVWIAVAKGRPVSTEGDLISRKALKAEIDKLFKNGGYDSGLVLELIDNAPTVSLQDIYQEGHYDGHLEGYTKAINEERPQGKWICPNCDLYDHVEDDYCQYAGECTIGCRECKYFKQKGDAE